MINSALIDESQVIFLSLDLATLTKWLREFLKTGVSERPPLKVPLQKEPLKALWLVEAILSQEPSHPAASTCIADAALELLRELEHPDNLHVEHSPYYVDDVLGLLECLTGSNAAEAIGTLFRLVADARFRVRRNDVDYHRGVLFALAGQLGRFSKPRIFEEHVPVLLSELNDIPLLTFDCLVLISPDKAIEALDIVLDAMGTQTKVVAVSIVRHFAEDPARWQRVRDHIERRPDGGCILDELQSVEVCLHDRGSVS